MRDSKGVPMRVHLERAAQQGRESARARLQGPQCPEPLRYLRTWLYRMHGKSGIGMSGAQPLTPSTVLDFCKAFDVQFDPWEIELLLEADVAIIAAANKKE